MLVRALESQVRRDLKEKMVFVSGPRQSGKTTLARAILDRRHRDPADRYLNWDDDEARTRILRRTFPRDGLLVFDELHKYTRWRNFLKGLYDTHRGRLHILVTGSARLDLYRRGGDSLQGRYHHLRLLPLSRRESGASVADLLARGPFPEPLLSKSATGARRWSREYRTRLVRDDVAGLERVEELGALEEMSVRLPALVGSPLSVNALREDLQVAHRTVERWLGIFDRLMFTFTLLPWGPPRIKAVRKQRKHYQYDWTVIEDEGARFENLVAFHLMKVAAFLEDTEGLDAGVRFFRDREGREVDFVEVRGKRAVRFVEAKAAETRPSDGLRYVRHKFPDVPAVQVVRTPGVDRVADLGIRVVSADRFLAELPA